MVEGISNKFFKTLDRAIKSRDDAGGGKSPGIDSVAR